jgi:hypothetical protein
MDSRALAAGHAVHLVLIVCLHGWTAIPAGTRPARSTGTGAP